MNKKRLLSLILVLVVSIGVVFGLYVIRNQNKIEYLSNLCKEYIQNPIFATEYGKKDKLSTLYYKDRNIHIKYYYDGYSTIYVTVSDSSATPLFVTTTLDYNWNVLKTQSNEISPKLVSIFLFIFLLVTLFCSFALFVLSPPKAR